MKTKYSFIAVVFLLFFTQEDYCQRYPAFGTEIPVTINGLIFDAMEPSISSDGNYIFFNSLNDGITTSLYYASRIDDSTFNYIGTLTGANQTGTPRLDAVASSDSANNFYWVSTRDFPDQFDNYFHGIFNGTGVESIGRVHGTFYIYIFGWIIMDATVNYQGNLLYYCNAYMNSSYSGCSGMPCQAKLGVAQKQNDSTFNKLINSDEILQNINDTNYLIYAPCITKDELELYYTRILKSNRGQTEICVSVRNSPADAFSEPSIIFVSDQIPEAPTLTADKSKMYYHKKSNGLNRLFFRQRLATTGIIDIQSDFILSVYPNPFLTEVTLQTNQNLSDATLTIENAYGQTIKQIKNISGHIITLKRDNLPGGLYFIRLTQGCKIIATRKIIITS